MDNHKTTQHIVVIGGGISGLTTAYRLMQHQHAKRMPWHITVLEAHDRFGGVICTQQRDSFLMEEGPDCFATARPWARDFCEELGLANELVAPHPGCNAVTISSRGQLAQLPTDCHLMVPATLRAWAALPFMSWRGKLRLALEFMIPPEMGHGDESVGQFVKRRFGHEALDQLAQPLFGGIFGCDTKQLSLQATFPGFRDMERQHGSLIQALWVQRRERLATQATDSDQAPSPVFMTLRPGLTALIERLLQRLSDVRLVDFTPVDRVVREHDQWMVQATDGTSFCADAVCLATPAHQASRLCQETSPELARLLEGMTAKSMLVVHAGFRTQDLPQLPLGSGIVVAPHNGLKIMGVTFCSRKFLGRAPTHAQLLRMCIGEPWCHTMDGMDDHAIAAEALQDLRTLLNIRATPLLVSVARHPQTMPQYRVGHLDIVERIQHQTQRTPGIFVTGNAYRGGGLPGCIHEAESTANRMIDYLQQRSSEVVNAAAPR